MLAVIPYEVRTLYQRNPWGNLALIVVTVAVSSLASLGVLSDDLVDTLILKPGGLINLIGYQFLHAGFWHLLGNMLLLFVFGNAICGVMNTFLYVVLYLSLGVAAAAVHLLFDGSPAVGASGALCGIMGLYLAVYPQNQVNCFWLFLIRGGTFGLPGWVLIVGWFVLDLLGAVGGGADIAYWAHVGGTVSGFSVGLALLKFRKIDLFDYDHPTVLQLFPASGTGGRDGPAR